MVYDNDMPELLDESELPLLLPDVEEYKPGGQARSPLAALTDWVNLPMVGTGDRYHARIYRFQLVLSAVYVAETR